MSITSKKLINFILNRYDVDISIFDNQYILKMIESSLVRLNFKTVESFIEYLNSNKKYFLEFYNTLLNGYSLFFRQDLNYSVLQNKILPNLIENLNNQEELRIWSVGCSCGQEPYSIAILCEELKLKLAIDFKYRIFATDISKSCLNKGKKGNYKTSDILNTKYKYLISYFDKELDEYHIKDYVKKNVYFSEFNVVTSKHKYPPESIYGDFDLVICNNLLIYYNKEVKEDIVKKLISSVKIDGYYVTSEAEIDYVRSITKEERVLCESSVLKKSKKGW